ncbi:hypothetical protein D3C80_1612220 [compost metagenome]
MTPIAGQFCEIIETAVHRDIGQRAQALQYIHVAIGIGLSMHVEVHVGHCPGNVVKEFRAFLRSDPACP